MGTGFGLFLATILNEAGLLTSGAKFVSLTAMVAIIFGGILYAGDLRKGT